jgi:curved DNA-binding protein CbpA
MAQLASGSVSDRPWGLTLGALGMRGLSGQLTLIDAGKTFIIAFEQGAVIGSFSPLVSDAAVRLALTSNLVTSTQVADITRRMAAMPDREEVEVLAELARLAPDQAARLRRRLVAQRAARTFSLDRGNFVIEDEITLPIVPGNELDIRAIIYMGAKNMLSEDRLAAELDVLGGWYRLKQERLGELAQYGFTAAEKPALQMLVEGANVVDVERTHTDIGSRTVRAIVYALASCQACEVRSGPSVAAATPPPQPVVSRTGTGSGRTATPAPRMQASSAVPVTPPASAPRTVTPTPDPARMRRPSTPPPGSENWAPTKSPTIPPPIAQPVRMNPPTQPPPSAAPVTAPPVAPSPAPVRTPRAPAAAPRRAKRNTAATLEIDQLLTSKIPLLDQGADHYTLLGLPQSASPDEIRQTYFLLARKLHPDRLSAIGVVDEARNAQRLMAEINAAFAVLNDTAKREEYLSVLARGGEAAIAAEDARADEMAMRVLRAEEVFRMGEMALRRDQLAQAIDAFKQAVELQPNESEYQAMLAWAQFAAAPDKNALANTTRRALMKAAEANERSPTARFFLGRVERMLGKEREALQHFQEVLRIKPNHSEAASEARILEQRLKGKR